MINLQTRKIEAENIIKKFDNSSYYEFISPDGSKLSYSCKKVKADDTLPGLSKISYSESYYGGGNVTTGTWNGSTEWPSHQMFHIQKYILQIQ